MVWHLEAMESEEQFRELEILRLSKDDFSATEEGALLKPGLPQEMASPLPEGN